MAGKALRKRILTDVANNGGADWLYDQIASGVTVAEIARQYGCTRSYVSRAINSNPEYKAALEGAREEAADALVEQGLEMVDELSGDSSSNEIAATREKVNFRKFMAGSMNQSKYGTRPQSNVTISIGDMHLDALRKVNSQMAAIEAEDRAREQSIDTDYEDVTDES
jgi:transposase-like protein